MTIATALFYLFSAVLLFAAFRVITARNTVHAALFLVLAFFQASTIWMLLEAEFLSIVLVLVYVGAVMVLFLFVVMMLDVNVDELRQGFWRFFPVAALFGVFIVLEMSAVLMQGFQIGGQTAAAQVGGQLLTPAARAAAQIPNTELLGRVLYGAYLYPLEIAAVILLVAIIAAIALTLRKRKDTKSQRVADQLRVRAADRVRLVKIPAHAPAPAAAAAATDKGE
ncbi:NADH-quinone oxidoreductase subunit J [Thiomonas sp.]|jgi:NADH-quinone oxidoreductase subunit J|uniref:NADH-quinone oxidoreductase subunit J n=1 Tax=Thiomonas sp. TaxID=2047785 RepID=UPI0026264ED9|nr:NADH-quinone oxidoreductase subunit J [Thiomonas sp.]